ncbi:MAG: alpha/beta hydrolase [Actinobacteria bacterium]|nr:alpha/beta hydrolase [Actinomycetota bacterium]
MFTQVNGVKHHYHSSGEGPPVVLIHGLGGTLDIWHGVAQLLSLHHHVVALDLRGHGRTGAGRAQFSIKSWSQDVAGLMAELELPAATIVGHSMGSLIAQHLAVTAPELVDQLVLVGGISYFEPPDKEAYEQRAKIVDEQGLDEIVHDWLVGALSPRTHARLPQVTGLLRHLFLSNDPRSYAKACRALSRAPAIEREQIGQPTLLLVGDHDRSTPLRMSEQLHRQIPVSRVQVVPSAAHWMTLEHPDVLAAAILQFLT